MVIAVASIGTSVYKYVIQRITISYAVRGAISAQIGGKHHLFVVYLYCIYIVLLYLWSTYMNNMRIWFTILFHLKTMTATTFNTFQACECLLCSPPSLVHNMTALNFKSSSIQPKIVENCCRHPSFLQAMFINK